MVKTHSHGGLEPIVAIVLTFILFDLLVDRLFLVPGCSRFLRFQIPLHPHRKALRRKQFPHYQLEGGTSIC